MRRWRCFWPRAIASNSTRTCDRLWCGCAPRYRLFAVSNGNADLQRCGVADLFDGHVSAIAAGAAKPDARIFAALRRMAGVSAAEVLHVGDDPIADVVGAMRAGMQAVWLNRESRARGRRRSRRRRAPSRRLPKSFSTAMMHKI